MSIGVDRPEEQLPERVGLMVLTAITRDGSGDVRERMEFCAAVDTGTTRTLCSRKMTERLFHTWQPSECKRYKMFNGDPANYKVMTRELELEKINGDTVKLRELDFIDQELPFSKYLPNDERVPKRIDMILGSDFAWKHLIEPLIGRCSVLSLPTSFSLVNHVAAIDQPAVIHRPD